MYRIVILTLLLGACSKVGYAHRDHPIPGSDASREAMVECGLYAPETKSEPELRKDWLLAFVTWIVPGSPGFTDDVCDAQCWAARRHYSQCMAEGGWVSCERIGFGLRCERRPS